MRTDSAAKRLGDGLALLAIVAAMVCCYDPYCLQRHGTTIQVGPEAEVASIQAAADVARPGDEVVIAPGVYRERIRIRRGGEPGRPVTFRAQVPGTVLISGAAAAGVVESLVWQREPDGLFSTQPPWPVYFLRAEGLALLPCESLDALRDLTSRANAWGAFHQAPTRLYVYRPDGRAPSAADTDLHGPVPPRLANGVWNAANVWVDADHVRFRDLHFDLGVAHGVRVWDRAQVVVEDCLFTGTRVGVTAGSGTRPCLDLRVERCAYHNYPQAEWRRTWLDKTTLYPRVTDHCLVVSRDDGAVIRGNLVVHANDGLTVNSGDASVCSGIDVAGNLVAYCTDDAVEIEGFARTVRFHHNLVYDTHESLGLSPVLAGPVTIDHNLFLHPSAGINGAQIKLMHPALHFGPPWNGPIRNVKIHSNTFVGNWLCWWRDSPMEDITVCRNVFAVQRQKEPPWPNGVSHRDNVYIEMPHSGFPNPGRDRRWLTNRLPEDTRRADPAVSSDGPGATPTGRLWTMKRPGPRWLAWESLPATRRLLDDLDPELFER